MSTEENEDTIDYEKIAEEAAASIDHDRIVREAVESATAKAKQSNTRNGILSLALGIFITIGGVFSLSAGIGIFLLIAGIMLLVFGGFLLYLAK